MYDGKERRDQWYTPRELFEQMLELGKELQTTKERLHKYNGLHDRFDGVEKDLADVKENVGAQITRCDKVQASMQGKGDVIDRLIQMWPIIITTIMAIYTFWRTGI